MRATVAKILFITLLLTGCGVKGPPLAPISTRPDVDARDTTFRGPPDAPSADELFPSVDPSPSPSPRNPRDSQ